MPPSGREVSTAILIPSTSGWKNNKQLQILNEVSWSWLHVLLRSLLILYYFIHLSVYMHGHVSQTHVGAKLVGANSLLPLRGVLGIKLKLLNWGVSAFACWASYWFQFLHSSEGWPDQILFICLLRYQVLLYSSGWPRTSYVDEASLKLTEIYLPLPSGCWN